MKEMYPFLMKEERKEARKKSKKTALIPTICLVNTGVQ
jgi:hypothetical protein